MVSTPCKLDIAYAQSGDEHRHVCVSLDTHDAMDIAHLSSRTLFARLRRVCGSADPSDKEDTIIDFNSVPYIAALFESTGKTYRKKAVTLARRPRPEEVGQTLVTYVADKSAASGLRVETVVSISAECVIARNPAEVAPGVFNEWLIPHETWHKNYGALPQGEAFEARKKHATITAIDITPEVLGALGSTDGKTARIRVDWCDTGMEIHVGGLLASAGYGISPVEAAETYETVQ